MRYINSNITLHDNFIFILNKQIEPFLRELPKSKHYKVIFLDFNTKYSNSIQRSFDEWDIVTKYIEPKIKEIIFMDIDPYLLLLTTKKFRSYKLGVKGILFEPYTHFKTKGVEINFLFLKKIKSYFFQKIPFYFNKNINRIFILNDMQAVNMLNKSIHDKFYFLPDPIDNKPLEINEISEAEIISKYKISSEKHTLLIFGSIDARKNLKSILEALSMLPESYRKSVHLIVAGKFGVNLSLEYKNLLNIASENFSIYFNDNFINDYERDVLFKNAEIVLMPYINFYSSSGVLGHVIKHNKKVIVSNLGLLWRIVNEYGIGVSVNPYDNNQISKGIITLLDNYHLNANETKNNFQLLSKFSPQNFSKTLLLTPNAN